MFLGDFVYVAMKELAPFVKPGERVEFSVSVCDYGEILENEKKEIYVVLRSDNISSEKTGYPRLNFSVEMKEPWDTSSLVNFRKNLHA